MLFDWKLNISYQHLDIFLSDGETYRRTYEQTDRQTDRQTGTRTERHTDK